MYCLDVPDTLLATCQVSIALPVPSSAATGLLDVVCEEAGSRHPSAVSGLIDKGADILYTPHRYPWGEFYRLWKSPGSDPSPPGGSADGDDWGNGWVGFRIADNLCESKITSFW